MPTNGGFWPRWEDGSFSSWGWAKTGARLRPRGREDLEATALAHASAQFSVPTGDLFEKLERMSVVRICCHISLGKM